VRNYFDATRKSYGLLIQPEAGNPFSGKYHVGDDCAWQQDHETVVAIGHGIVRSVDLGRKSWGGLVIVEHADAGGGRFCSLYGHLGPLVCVQPGQVIRQGQKLGSVGPSYSHANGGYLAHLHFGIHRGAFLLPDRVGAIIQRGDGPGETATVTAVREETAEIRLADGDSRTIDRRANWTGGYLTPAEFTAKTHGWVEPQEFIRKFR
jgi:murein DD-endopeptidase MepM/ murein hydrolase activator NlpD